MHKLCFRLDITEPLTNGDQCEETEICVLVRIHLFSLQTLSGGKGTPTHTVQCQCSTHESTAVGMVVLTVVVVVIVVFLVAVVVTAVIQ